MLVLTVLGWLRGKRPILRPGFCPSAAPAQSGEASTPSTGEAGEQGLEIQPTLEWAMQLAL